MSSSKAVYSFFDPAEINKSFSGKAPASPAGSQSVNVSYESTGSHTSDHESRSRSFSSAASHSCSQAHATYSSSVSNPNASYESHNTGEISIEYSAHDDEKSSCSGRSAMTERAANKSPEAVVRCGRLNGASGGGGGLGSTSGLSSASGGMGNNSSLRGTNSFAGAGFERTASDASGVSANTAPAGNVGAHRGNANSLGGNSTREANYEEGASELFLLVENAAWQEAITRVNQYPEEARVWINSSGTENTVFSWSVWRRLPLHEACRRQPPPVLVYALLAAFPQSTSAESHFGELPLHAAVRCGACAEVVNCLLAAYPAAVFARDNSGCTPLDILNGTGKMMDHDAVVAALTRTITVLTKEEQEWQMKIKSMEKEFEANKEKKRQEYDRMVESKNQEIEDLRRELEQEKLATSNLAKKVIQTEKVVELKSSLETRYQERLKKCEEDIKMLKTSNAQRKAKIKEMESVTITDKKSIAELNSRVQQLQAQITAVCDEEETFVATTVAKAESQVKILLESQLLFMKEQEKKKDRLRARVSRLGITLPPKKFPSDFEPEEKKMKEDEVVKEVEVSDEEVAEKALAAAMRQFAIPDDD